MDTIYIADLDPSYRYFSFSGDYFTVYNVPSARNQTITGYRFYYKLSPGAYHQIQTTIGNNTQTYIEMSVSNEIWARSDIAYILVVVMIICLFVKYLINSAFKIYSRGGIL